jgi:hypothetical protein
VPLLFLQGFGRGKRFGKTYGMCREASAGKLQQRINFQYHLLQHYGTKRQKGKTVTP